MRGTRMTGLPAGISGLPCGAEFSREIRAAQSRVKAASRSGSEGKFKGMTAGSCVGVGVRLGSGVSVAARVGTADGRGEIGGVARAGRQAERHDES